MKRNSTVFLIVVLIFVLILNYNIKSSDAQGALKNIHKTTLAQQIESDFAGIDQEELIVEMAGEDAYSLVAHSKNMSQAGSLEIKKDINDEIIGETSFFLINSENRDVLSGQDLIEVNIEDIKRNEVVDYVVQAGDTVSGIAQKFGLNVNTILWENNLTARSLIRPGITLKILPDNGVMHTVARNENISTIASRYGVTSDDIIKGNNMEDGVIIKIGDKLFVPGGRKVVSTATAVRGAYSGTTVPRTAAPSQTTTYSGGKLLWPTVGSRITQYYSWRHQGLDIANKTGTPLYAAESGTVERSGWNSGYGYNVVINHGGGLKTLSAHASKLHVRAGDWVNRGDVIADMGSTGWSTGPHIHFEVILNGVKQNPLNYLR